MIATPWVLATLVLAQDPAPLAPSKPAEPERQFDFWIGEWSVQNRALQKDGSWVDAGTSVARIRPILGGTAILEEWDGRTGYHQRTFGISVRYFDPATGRWVIGLNWPNAQAAGFSRMEGSFRHGRAEFFPPSAFGGKPPRATRFTFSDALPETCRWDMATPVAGGGWKTSWIMEFSRTKSVIATRADGEPIGTVPEKCVCATEEARQFDRFVGAWSGSGRSHEEGGAKAVRATLRVSSTNRGCATLCFLDVQRGARVDRSFEAWAWQAQRGCWEAQALDDRAPRLDVLIGGFDGDLGEFVRTDAQRARLEQTRRVRYEVVDAATIRLRRERTSDGGATWSPVLELDFTRS